MDSVVSLQDAANIITFIAPGYFAIQAYSIVHAKRQRDFSYLLVESVVFSVPIVALVSLIWSGLFGRAELSATNAEYSLLILVAAIGSGLLCAYLRVRWPVKQLALKYGFGSPNGDFVKTQFSRLGRDKPAVTVCLKDGTIFSGTPSRMSRYVHDEPQHYYFTNLAWFNAKTNRWNERTGGILIESSEVLYIETPPLNGD